MTINKDAKHTIDGGWFEAVVTYEPTSFDSTGCDGMYIESVNIKYYPGEVTDIIKDILDE